MLLTTARYLASHLEERSVFASTVEMLVTGAARVEKIQGLLWPLPFGIQHWWLDGVEEQVLPSTIGVTGEVTSPF